MWSFLKGMFGGGAARMPATTERTIEGLGPGKYLGDERWCFHIAELDVEIAGFEGPREELLPFARDVQRLVDRVPAFIAAEAAADTDGHSDEILALQLKSIHIWDVDDEQVTGMLYFDERPSGWLWRTDFVGLELGPLGFDR